MFRLEFKSAHVELAVQRRLICEGLSAMWSLKTLTLPLTAQGQAAMTVSTWVRKHLQTSAGQRGMVCAMTDADTESYLEFSEGY